MQPFFLRFYQPLPPVVPYDLETLRSDGIALDVRRTSLQWATQLPGGWGQMTAGFDAEFAIEGEMRRVGWLDRSVECPPQGYIVVSTPSGGVVYAGRRNKPSYDAGRFRSVEAHGLGTDALDDSPLLTFPNISSTSAGVLRYMLGTLQPPMPVGNINQFQDPGVPHSLYEFSDRTPAEVVSQLTKEGGAQNNLFDFTVYGSRVANFVPRIAPSQPDYWLPYDNTTHRTEDDAQLYSTVKVTYTTPTVNGVAGVATSITQTNPMFYATYGFVRGKVVPGGTLTDEGAAQFAATWLQLHGQPWISITVTRDATRGLELYAGAAQRPSYYARAGEWASVGNEGPFVVIKTQYTAHTDTFTMDIGQPQGGFLQAMSLITESSTALRRDTSPNTGAKAA